MIICPAACLRTKHEPYSSSVHQPGCPVRTEKDEIVEMIEQAKDIEILKQIADDILSLKPKGEIELKQDKV